MARILDLNITNIQIKFEFKRHKAFGLWLSVARCESNGQRCPSNFNLSNFNLTVIVG